MRSSQRRWRGRAPLAHLPGRATNPGRRRRMKSADIEFMFATLQRANPHPASELLYSSTFELLAAVLLSAQATDASVNSATRRLFALAPTPQAMLALGEAALCDHIRTHRPVPHQGQAPDRDLPHPGRAPWRPGAARPRGACRRCRASAARQPTWCSTWHSANRRWRSTRMCSASPTAPGWRRAAPPMRWSKACWQRCRDPYRTEAHHWLILHGRYVCTARSPDCRACAINSVCAAFAASGGAPTLQ